MMFKFSIWMRCFYAELVFSKNFCGTEISSKQRSGMALHLYRDATERSLAEQKSAQHAAGISRNS